METVSTLVNNVSNLLVTSNSSNFSHLNDDGRASGLGGNEAMLMEFNALLIADFRHVEKTLFALQRNLDDFYFVVLTAITFGNFHSIRNIFFS